jgi:hypothetical protein
LGPPYASDGWNSSLAGINYKGGTAVVQLHVGDGQGFGDDGVILNGVTVVPAGAIFQGTSVQNEPSSVTLGSGDGGLWDILSWNIPSGVLSLGTNAVTLTTGTFSNQDYVSVVVMVVSVPHNAPLP